MWTPIDSLPELGKYPYISLDTETYDPQLKEKGVGVRRNGNIVGMSIGLPTGEAFYLPIAHTDISLPTKKIMDWAKVELCHPNQPKIGANILYDLDYLYHAGIKVTPPFYDVQIAEALLNENRKEYNLNALAKDYLGLTKDFDELEEFCKQNKLKGEPRSHIYRMPATIVGPYAEKDAYLPLKIFEIQKKKLIEEELWELFTVESELTEVLLHMRRRGVKIDVDAAENLIPPIKEEIGKISNELSDIAGQEVGFWKANQIAVFLDKIGVQYPLTAKTKAPSIKKDWLESIEHSKVKVLQQGRKLDKFLGTFLEGQILGSHIGGRIYPEFNQTRGDTTGTVTGRLSGTNPNMQFMPARDGELGPLCRGLFLPEEGELWGRLDYSQIELRILAHFAIGPGSNTMRQTYIDNPDIDFHQMTADMAGCSRRSAKDINFGLVYGMGKKKLAMKLGIDYDAAVKFQESYLEKLPFLKKTSEAAISAADKRGFVRTILKRRRRFTKWEPRHWELSKGNLFQTHEDALDWQQNYQKEHGKFIRIGRAHTYAALNAVVQGSAADLMKKAMVDYHRSGVVDVLGYPLLTIHDELDLSVPNTKEGLEAFDETRRLMENSINFLVPVIAEAKLGKHWGECK